MPMEWQMALAKLGFAVPLKIFTIVNFWLRQKNPPLQGGEKRPRI
jgi:hypothetical protein